MNRLQKSFGLIRRLSLLNTRVRLISQTSIVKGASHGHTENHGHSSSGKKGLFAPTEIEERGWAYREIRNMTGRFSTALGEILMTFLWFWIFYNFWNNSADFFGHGEYPDTSKWTDQELGIPPDEE